MKRTCGPIEQKILLALFTGTLLLLNSESKNPWKIIKAAADEWEKINARGLERAVKRLHSSKLLYRKKVSDGTIIVTLSPEGKTKALIYNLEKMKLQKPEKWDGLWRIVLFDIPEYKKKGRDALAGRLKKLGFHALQKSVFVHPYECANEINCITELFQIRPYVRMIIAQDIDNVPNLKKKFKLA